MDLTVVIALGTSLLIGNAAIANGEPCLFQDAFTSTSSGNEPGSYNNATVDIDNVTCSFTLQIMGPLLCPNDTIRLASTDAEAIPVSWTPPDSDSWPLLSSHQPGDMFRAGGTTRVWHSLGGNNSCNFTVTVNYPECPSDVEISLSEAKTAVNWTDPSPVTDYAITADRTRGPIDAAGVYPVTYTFTQTGCGMVCSPNATCSFDIVVYDDDAPEILDCPKDVSLTTTDLRSLPEYTSPKTLNKTFGDVLVAAESTDADYQYRQGVNPFQFIFMNKYTNRTAPCRFSVTVELYEECDSGVNMALVIILAVGYILWVVTALVICCRAVYSSTSCRGGVNEPSSPLPSSPPPQEPAPTLKKEEPDSGGIYNNLRLRGSYSYDEPASNHRCHPDEWAKPCSDSDGEGSYAGISRGPTNALVDTSTNPSGTPHGADNPARVPVFPFLESREPGNDIGDNRRRGLNSPRKASESGRRGKDRYTFTSPRAESKADHGSEDPYAINPPRKWSGSDLHGRDPYATDPSRKSGNSDQSGSEPYAMNQQRRRSEPALNDNIYEQATDQM